MARVSFTLRNPTTTTDNIGGSYVRYDTSVYNAAASANASPGVWLYDEPEGLRDYDSALRGDGILLPPNEVVSGYFEATAVCYGIVNLRYGIPIDTTVSPSSFLIPIPTEALVVASASRFPISVSDGRVISRSTVDVDQDFYGFTPGNWVYFTLFVRYQGINDDYYYPTATLQVLMSRNYQSTLLLWERLPEHYRTQDELIGSTPNSFNRIETGSGDVVAPSLGCSPDSSSFGPLFRFLSVFGFEMDKNRTLIDHIMVSRDPYKASSYDLSSIAWELGLGLPPGSINLDRARRILESHNHILKNKGTVTGLKQLIKSFSNCESDVDESNHSITIYSQRVNYCYNPANGEDYYGNPVTYRVAHEVEAVIPTFVQGEFDPNTFDPADSDTFPTPLDSYEVGIYWLASASAGSFGDLSIPVEVGDYIVMYGDPDSPKFGVRPTTFAASTYDGFDPLSVSGSVYSMPSSNVTSGVTHAWFRFPSPLPVLSGDHLYARIAKSEEVSRMVRLGRVATADDGTVVGEGGVGVDGLYRYASVPTFDTDVLSETDWTICFIELLVDLANVPSEASTLPEFSIENVLVERNYIGEYFDGNKADSTWVINPDGLPSGKDHRWSMLGDYPAADQTDGPGISVYSEEFYKTVPLLQSVFKDAIPAEEYGKYSYGQSEMVYDGIPGLDGIESYYTSIAP